MELKEKTKKFIILNSITVFILLVLLLIGSRNLLCLTGGGAFAVIFFVSYYLYIAKPFQHAQEQLEKYENEGGLAAKRTKELAVIYDKQAQLAALQSQINPHFLYNTLESIRGQALIDDNVGIAKMVEALASFFRYSISKTGNLVTLREELSNIHNYMMIQRYRFNNRFSLEIIIDGEDEGAFDFLVPRLMIQPIVENAVFHGLEEKLEGGKVIIEIIVTDENLILTISDNGKGMSSEKLATLNQKIRAYDRAEIAEDSPYHTGIALDNVHKRIQLLFGKNYGISIFSTMNQGTDVEITIPANYKRCNDEERNHSD